MKTIFIKNTYLNSPTINYIKLLGNISVNSNEDIKSDYVFFNEYEFNNSLDYCNKHNIDNKHASLINKYNSYQLYNKYNFSTASTIKPLQLTDIENLDDDTFFIKPVIGANSNKFFISESDLISQSFYTPIRKQSLIEILSLEDSTNFWTNQQNEHSGVLIQKYCSSLNNSLENPNHYIQNGFCNGSGQVIFSNPTLGIKSINKDFTVSLTSTTSSENLTNEVIILQQKITNMLTGEGIKNCIFSMQFFKYNNNFVPIDCNLRLPYGLIKVCNKNQEYKNYLKSCVEFTYDIVDNIPIIPNISSALTVYSNTLMNQIYAGSFVATGTTKEEALSNLQNLNDT